MTCYLCATPERWPKTSLIMNALAAGMGGQVVHGAPPQDDNPFVVWGQRWLAEKILPDAVKTGRPFWHIDNGFWSSAKGSARGYYRITYRSMASILLRDAEDLGRQVETKPWRVDGDHVLLAMPGADFGKPVGIDVRSWMATIEKRLRSSTNRQIIVRPKGCAVTLSQHLKNCWALVTHSSNVAVDAILAGVPVFVEPTSPAAPVGKLDLDIENPLMPDREDWLRSLMCQQFTLDEMRSGLAWRWMKKIAAQVDGDKPCQ